METLINKLIDGVTITISKKIFLPLRLRLMSLGWSFSYKLEDGKYKVKLVNGI